MSDAVSGVEVRLAALGGIELVRFPRLAAGGALVHGVSGRAGGVSRGGYASLNLSFRVGDDPLCVQENRRLLARAAGLPLPFVCARQVHGNRVLWIQKPPEEEFAEAVGEGDALLTALRGVPLAVLAADCLPILFHDPVNRAVGVAHAGWKGTLASVAERALRAMREAFGTDPARVRAALGPRIGACCLEVGPEVAARFVETFPWGKEVLSPGFGDRMRLDLGAANRRQLEEAGVPANQVLDSGLCTVRHRDRFFSHRLASVLGRPAGRFAAFIMLK